MRTSLAVIFLILAVAGFGSGVPNSGSAAPIFDFLLATDLVCPPNYAGMVGGAVLGGAQQTFGRQSWNLTCYYRLVTNDDRIDVAVSWYPKDTTVPKDDQPFFCGTANQGIDKVQSKTKAAYAAYKGANRRFEIIPNLNAQAKSLAELLLAAAEDLAVDCGSIPTATAPARTPTAAPARTATPAATPVPPRPSMTVAPRATATKAADLPRCVVNGWVRDAGGSPVTGVRMRLLYGKLEKSAFTDDQGSYRFSEIGGGGEVESSFDPRKDRVKVMLSTEEFAHKPSRFVLNYRQKPAQVESDSFLLGNGEDCARTFDFAALNPGPVQSTAVGGGNRVYSFLNPGEATAKEVWPELLRMYGNFQKAWALADKLNYDDLDYGLPLQIFAWCDDPEKLCTPMTDRGDPNDYAFFHGSNSIDPTGVPRPWISISVDASSARAKDAPDMLEFHEFGHFFQADMMRNALPRDAFVRPHGGMYANESSADAWVEGFASFYATLVAREITVEPFPSQLRIGKQGVMLDMEQNYMAWDGDGALEEFAVTGLLWDFVDGSGDYQRLPKKHNLETRNSSVVDVAPEQIMFTGEVVNRDSTTSERTQITMKYVDNPGNVGYVSGPTSPEDIPPGGVARFYLPLPKGTFVQNWEFSIEALPVGDDDPLQVEASELMASIEGFKSEKASGGGRLFDVQDLYLALKKDFGGRARAANGLDAVDAIFISHGFFADLNGNGQHDGAIDPEGSCLPQIQKATLTAGKAKVVEEIGMTSYCQKGTHEAVIPRYSPADLPKESTAIVDTGGVQARALVLITFPPQSGRAGYGYFFDPDPAGKVSLAMPPRESEATMILLMLADGYAPAVAAEIKSADFWAQADKSPGKSFLSYQVNLKLGELTRSSSPLTSPLSFYLAGGVILVAVSLGILVFLRFHRRSASQD